MNEEETVTQRRREIVAIIATALVLIGGVSWYVSYAIHSFTQPHTAIDTRPVTVLADCPDDAGVRTSASPVKMAALGTVVDPLVFATGVSGTYTVPRGYVVGLSAIASANPDGGLDSGGVGATVTITPNGPGITDGAAVTQPPILIPAGYNWSIGRPVIQGSVNEMGAGTTIVFYGTQTYTVVMSLGGS